jgi:hypothetical protein
LLLNVISWFDSNFSWKLIDWRMNHFVNLNNSRIYLNIPMLIIQTIKIFKLQPKRFMKLLFMWTKGKMKLKQRVKWWKFNLPSLGSLRYRNFFFSESIFYYVQFKIINIINVMTFFFSESRCTSSKIYSRRTFSTTSQIETFGS